MSDYSSINDLGDWEVYRPEEPDPSLPVNMIHYRRVQDGADWFAFSRDADDFREPSTIFADPGAVFATCLKVEGGYLVQAVTRDWTLVVPSGSRVIVLHGVDPDLAKVHAPFEQRRYDPDTLSITDWPVRVPTSCSRLGLKRAFDELKLWPTVRAMIEADPDRAEEWSLATTIRPTDPLVQGAIGALAAAGVAVDVDQLLVRAAALTA